MTTLQTFLLAGTMAVMFLICVVIIIIAGQVHQIVQGINALVELGERSDLRQGRFVAIFNRRPRNHDYDPK